jgi:NNP family nitrate/nitrite transporter-like MFS transporter
MVIFRRKHAWLLGWLYAGTFGSFIGFAAGFPMLLASQFAGSGAAKYAFIGPLLGAVVRPLGGWLADRLGGARVSLWNFAVMALAMYATLVFLPSESDPGRVGGFFAGFLVLFLTAGIGNGSVFRMVPSVFAGLHQRGAADQDEVAQARAIGDAEKETAVALGFTASLAAFGGFYIPLAVGLSINLSGLPVIAMASFCAFYLSCVLTTWWWYFRPGAEAPC